MYPLPALKNAGAADRYSEFGSVCAVSLEFQVTALLR